MIPALFRALYFFGPVLALAPILMPAQRGLAKVLWGFAAAIVAIHWISFFSALQDNAEEVSLFGIATWTPILITTILAMLTEPRWRGWHTNPFVSQGLVCFICLLPSIAAFFLTLA